MKDLLSIPRVLALHPRCRDLFRAFIEELELAFIITIRVVQGGRTFPEQQAIWDQGRTTPGKIVTHAAPGQSYHNYFLAVDMVPFADGMKNLNWSYDFTQWIDTAQKYGITAGVTWPDPKKDPDHFEMTFGNNWRQLLEKYHKGDFIPGTQYVNI